MSSVVALITARAGSKGIVGKNMIPVCGKPLVQWTMEAALLSESLDRVILSTDDDSVADLGRQLGVEVPFERPSALAQDDSSHVDVVLHALEFIEKETGQMPDWFLLLQPTSPLRTSEDINAAVALIAEEAVDAIIGVEQARQHPALCFKRNDDGFLDTFFESGLKYWRRQDLPEALVVNGAIYVIRVERFLETKKFVPERSVPYLMPEERSVDIDRKMDLVLVEHLLEARVKS